MYRRDDFIRLNGLTIDQDKMFKRRGLFPVLIEEDWEERGWSQYQREDVFNTSLALALRESGVPMREASTHVVLVERPLWVRWWLTIIDPATTTPIWLAIAHYRHPALKGDELLPAVYIGPLGGLAKASKRTKAEFAELQPAIAHLNLVNVNGVVNAIRQRAQKHDIAIDLESMFAPPSSVTAVATPREKLKPPATPYTAYRSLSPKRPPKK